MNTQLLRNYLAWQSEMGGDEVLLPHPLVRKEKIISPPQQPAFQHADAFRPTSASNVFGDMARTFQSGSVPSGSNPRSDHTPSVKLQIPTPTKPTAPRVMEAISYPAFSNSADLWEYLSKESKTIFTSDKELSLLPGVGPMQAPLALVSLQPNKMDSETGNLFSGEAGVLLEKMMRAIRLECNALYRTSVLKHFSGERAWSRREYIKILPLLHLELGLVQAPIVVLLGEACAQAVLKTSKTVQELRQIPHREGNREFVVTHHPDELLQREEWKRKAWEDLQWLQRRMNQGQGLA